MKKLLKTIPICLLIFGISACSDPDPEKLEQGKPPTEIITITGVANAIEFGKDGYTATIETKDKDIYNALVSIVNLGGMQNFTSMEVGDKGTLKGSLYFLDGRKQLKVSEIINIEKTVVPLAISNSFEGISPGDKIADHPNLLEKTMLIEGEGDFDAYRIKNEKEGELGYLLPDPTDDTKVGNIFINHPTAKTADGFHVGSTFAEISQKYPEIEVHGSESEGRTYATLDKIGFRLDAANFTYELDRKKIPATAKVIEIMINR